jgi:hypothetical protein
MARENTSENGNAAGPTPENTAWQLEDFVDSVVLELDKTREILAVKAVNKPLSYTVKDLSLDLNIFPTYDGDQVKFTTARPGEQGASKVTIQLGSITDQQVRATSQAPRTRSDVTLDQIPIDKTTKKQLRKLGVSSVGDLTELEKKNIDIRKASDDAVDYGALANQIQKARRGDNPPVVRSVSLSMEDERTPCMVIRGDNLSVDPTFRPVAVVNQALAEVTSSSHREVKVRLSKENGFRRSNEVILTVDPYAVIRVNVKA